MNSCETPAKFEEIQTCEMLDRQKYHGIVKYIGLECSSPLQNPHPIQCDHREIQDL
jgi:hypothetical protein